MMFWAAATGHSRRLHGTLGHLQEASWYFTLGASGRGRMLRDTLGHCYQSQQDAVCVLGHCTKAPCSLLEMAQSATQHPATTSGNGLKDHVASYK